MAPPFPVTPVIKVEDDDENNSASGLAAGSGDQELRDKFKKDVQRLVQLRRKGLCASGSAQPPPLLPPPVQPPPRAPPPPPPAQQPWAKRPAMGPPPGFAGVRQPPLKQYQRSKPAGPKVPAQPPQQPAPNAHLAPGPASLPPLNVRRTRQRRTPQPATDDAHHALALPAPPPMRAGAGDLPQLQRRSAPKPQHPAAKKKPTVPCVLCGVLCMTASHLKLHEQGRKHRNKMACLAGKMNVQCQVCNVHLSGELNVEEHMAGKQHLWRLNSGA